MLISKLTSVLHPVSICITFIYICIAFCQLSYYRCLQLYCILSAFVLHLSTFVLHPVSFRITLVYIRIASCQLSYYRCLQLYCIMSAFVLQMSTTVLHNVSICPSKPYFSIKITPICAQFSCRRIGKIRIMFNKHHAILLGEIP